MKKYIIILFIFSSFLVIAGAREKVSLNTGSTDGSGTVATVNGIPITALDVLKVCGREEIKIPYMHDERDVKEQIHLLRMVTLENLIKRKLVLCDFIKKGYRFPVGFMQNYLDRIAVSYKLPNADALKKMVEGEGQNWVEFKKDAYENAAVNSLIYTNCYKNVFIRPQTVYEYYQNNVNNYTKPEQLELQILKIDKKGVQRKNIDKFVNRIKKELKGAGAKKFSDYVLMYSEGPNNKSAGNIGWIPKNKLRKDFGEALANAKLGDIVGPVNTKEAYYFIRLNNLKQQYSEPYRYVKEDIKEQLTQNMCKKEYDAYIESLRQKANIKYF